MISCSAGNGHRTINFTGPTQCSCCFYAVDRFTFSEMQDPKLPKSTKKGDAIFRCWIFRVLAVAFSHHTTQIHNLIVYVSSTRSGRWIDGFYFLYRNDNQQSSAWLCIDRARNAFASYFVYNNVNILVQHIEPKNIKKTYKKYLGTTFGREHLIMYAVSARIRGELLLAIVFFGRREPIVFVLTYL